MSGLRKAKKYDWKDSNMALFGSDTEKSVKKESAQGEPAWEGAGQEVGLQIWRIVKFEVKPWPKEDYGSFFSGDSYIILNTYKPSPDSEELAYDVHFWIGKYSTQDEFGTAAYKCVELDTYLDDQAVQHREVQGHESELFLDYFEVYQCMDGGADTGFRHVTPEEYRPRLLHFSGARKNIVIREIPLRRDKMNSGDVYILDLGLDIYQWNGSGSNKDERFKAMQFLQGLRSERNGRPNVETLEEDGLYDEHKFYQALTDDEEEDDEDQPDSASTPKLFRVSDEDGSLDMDMVKEGDLGMGDLDSKDVFVVDAGNELFVWVGKGASTAEKKNAMAYAHKHLMDSEHPLIPVSCFGEGRESENFRAAMAA